MISSKNDDFHKKSTENNLVISLNIDESVLLLKRAKRTMSHFDGAMTNDDSLEKSHFREFFNFAFVFDYCTICKII